VKRDLHTGRLSDPWTRSITAAGRPRDALGAEPVGPFPAPTAVEFAASHAPTGRLPIAEPQGLLYVARLIVSPLEPHRCSTELGRASRS
jgi:hypothetical protein